MKLGYGTYGMPTVDIFDALPRLRDIGYQAVEINVGEEWPTAPRKLSAAKRTQLTHTIRDLEFPPPVLMCLLPICTLGEGREAALDKFDEACALARDLNFGDGPIPVVSTPGGIHGDWDERKNLLRDTLLMVADRSAKHNVILAVEPHAGQMLDTPQKVAWLMKQTQHEFLKVNFDISHFHVAGIDLKQSVDLCAPYTVSTHVKDGAMIEGKVRYQLPGEGSLDLVAYFKAIADAGISCPVTVEVTAQIWRQEGYDPWPAAVSSFQALDNARREAGL
ncbi:MAG: sugar phosphate isomerase/epimerase [bacterium]|nr:sugar phosphate isomerase/epimerase [bacterium]